MYAEERRQAMGQLITRERRVSVTRLSEEFDVTTETVRRDLSILERIGLVRRVHGGAVPASSLAVVEAGLGERDTEHTTAKESIAAAALSLLPPSGSTIVIDAGSTTVRLAAALPRDHRLSVVTHCVPVAARLAGLPHIDLVLLPGQVRPSTQAAVGPDTIAALSQLRADVSFIGTNGISLDHGLSTPDRTEAATKRAIVAAGRRTVLLVDSSKIGIESTIRFATLDQVDTVVTDDGITDSDRSTLEQAGLEVVVA